MNTFIDYGAQYTVNDENDGLYNDPNDSTLLSQLKYFYQKDIEKKYTKEKWYIKAYYLHHLLDYFRETRFDINNLELIFQKYLDEKVASEFSDSTGKTINFQNELEEIFQLLREYKQELYSDLKGSYLLSLESKKNSKKKIF